MSLLRCLISLTVVVSVSSSSVCYFKFYITYSYSISIFIYIDSNRFLCVRYNVKSDERTGLRSQISISTCTHAYSHIFDIRFATSKTLIQVCTYRKKSNVTCLRVRTFRVRRVLSRGAAASPEVPGGAPLHPQGEACRHCERAPVWRRPSPWCTGPSSRAPAPAPTCASAPPAAAPLSARSVSPSSARRKNSCR